MKRLGGTLILLLGLTLFVSWVASVYTTGEVPLWLGVFGGLLVLGAYNLGFKE